MIGLVTVTPSANGCVGAAEDFSIIVHPLPDVDAGLDTTLCFGQYVILTATGAISYQWDNGVVNGVPFYPNSTITYNVIGTDANLCQNTDDITVTYLLDIPPVVDAGPDQVICFTDDVTLTAGGDAILYQWNNGVLDGIPFSFESNALANKISSKKIISTTESYAINIEYSTLKGTIYLTYKSINNNQKNLIDFLRDAQNFTQKHTAKADEIKEKEYINKLNRVYGMFYEVGGNAASQSQFYLTDSTEHFLTGSLYFYAKPNFDSIYPAVVYLRNDMRILMESLRWNN